MWKHFGNIKASYCTSGVSWPSVVRSHWFGFAGVPCSCRCWIKASSLSQAAPLPCLASCRFLSPPQLCLNHVARARGSSAEDLTPYGGAREPWSLRLSGELSWGVRLNRPSGPSLSGFIAKCRCCSWLTFFFLVPINRALPTVTSHPPPWRWSLLLGRKTQSENSQQDGLLGASPERQWVEASGGWSLVNREPAPQRLEGKKRWFRTPFWASTLCSATLDSFCSWKPDSQNFYA